MNLEEENGYVKTSRAGIPTARQMLHLQCASRGSASTLEEKDMLWTLFVILLVLWLLGLVTSYTLGGFVHILLVVAVAVLLIQLVTGRRAV